MSHNGTVPVAVAAAGAAQMAEVDLSAGTVAYRDTGGDGPVVVLVGGLMMDATLWDDVVAGLAPAHRCVVPVLPLGGHRRAMRPDADLSFAGLAELLAEFIDRLDLREVTLVACDWGGPQLTATRHPERLAALVLLSEEAFDNIPPGLPGRAAALSARVPGGVRLMTAVVGSAALRRLPMAFGRMAKRPIPAERVASWTAGLRTEPGVRRDLARYLRSANRPALAEATSALARFDRPTLVMWAFGDRVMPPGHGRSLRHLIPGAAYVEIDDSYTLLPLDRPDAVATHLARFVAGLDGRPVDGRAPAASVAIV